MLRNLVGLLDLMFLSTAPIEERELAVLWAGLDVVRMASQTARVMSACMSGLSGDMGVYEK